ncbi:cytochrome c-type biogenesis protein CcsB [Lysinibacter cavernae]|uniref:Cytochrome c-type biogenesis protein CcsB n=1 Tax=Lysinibacter cavernae TaxID=1640652 RepID=A0A7X5R247_9MICO|nr:c-type cytochrome biogenesis protein CcsB [Lysinibacter cavernae]NIH54087.1 cytochrome c-type biogenesis protein CcsB [Lysinibacter cavernae]
MENFEQYSQASLFSALLIYALAFIFYAVDLANRAGDDGATSIAAPRDSDRSKTKAVRIGFSLTVLGWVFHLAATVLRGLEGGRVPWANMYEFSLTATLAIVTIFILVQFVYDLRFLGTLITGLVLVFLGLTRMNYFVSSVPLPPALDSYWLVIHIVVAVLAVAFLTLSFGLSIAQLLQARRESVLAAQAKANKASGATVMASAGASGSVVVADGPALTDAARTGSDEPAGKRPSKAPFAFLRSFPNSNALENLSYRMVIIGFVFWTFTLIAGSIWAEHAWGRYWGFDTKEVWTFIIWVLYAGFIHARATRGWRGNRSAWLSIIAYSTVIFNFTIVNVFFKGLHAYSGLPTG